MSRIDAAAVATGHPTWAGLILIVALVIELLTSGDRTDQELIHHAVSFAVPRPVTGSLVQNSVALVVDLARPFPAPIADQKPILKLLKEIHHRPPRLDLRWERDFDLDLRLPR
jgi:hypothetical protein